ncbi:MAG TPA: Crp/Fnr family transcriptional regulator [Vicinamibacterales bacterium]|nr:Crp/Fnr family transcriptional regulator [Vicinamibacterales bacterium]
MNTFVPSDSGNRLIVGNRLLALLPSHELQRLMSRMERVPMTRKRVLHKGGEPIHEVYFPNDGVCSMTTVMRDGRMVEVATIGNEGLVGLNAMFCRETTNSESLVQVPGTDAWALGVHDFRAELEQGTGLAMVVNRYLQAFLVMVLQSAACNSLHSAEERCARWLLMTRDRVGSEEFPMTQELLAVMLAVRRPTVTLILQKLGQRGLVRYSRGRLAIANGAGLEQVACECYSTVRAEFDRLLSPLTV